METILIVDDEINYTRILSAVLQEENYETITANSGPEALTILNSSDIDLVLTDMKMPGMDGIFLLEKIKQQDPELPVIMMTAHGTVEKAVEAMQKGAYSYILKPFDNDRLILFVEKAITMFRVVKENRNLRDAVANRFRFGNIIGKSKPMRDIFTRVTKVAPTQASVLIEGESGTGKELVAKSLHFNSPRSTQPFVAVNCAALAESLMESELFGHEKGAFTGAIAKKKGRFELADHGTLFLDEVGELPSSLQVKLLRVLQEKKFERVGGEKQIEVDIRLVSATNKSLKDEVRQGRFREDLYYRLNVVHIEIPPLRKRLEDIRLLADHFIQKFTKAMGLKSKIEGLNSEVDRLFSEYAWPGNVRELENVIEHAMILSAPPDITISDLPRDFKDNVTNTLRLDDISGDAKLYETLILVERKMILRALGLASNVQSKAAEILGIGKSGLNQKLKKHKIELRGK